MEYYVCCLLASIFLDLGVAARPIERHIAMYKKCLLNFLILPHSVPKCICISEQSWNCRRELLVTQQPIHISLLLSP